MRFSLQTVSLGLLAAGGLAAPLSTEVKDTRGLDQLFDLVNPDIGDPGKAIDAALFKTITLMGQFSSAAYCANNHNSVGDKIKCSGGSCPLVEAANTTTLAEFANFPGTDVTGYVALDHTNKLTIISFRGSSSIENWMTNLDFRDTTTDLCPGCTAHNGFWQSWVDARPGVLTAIKKAIATAPKYSIVATGHSLGGAIATLAAAQLRNEKHTVALYTFGAPRVSGPALAAYISAQPGGNFRVTNRNDPVPRLPPFFLGFTHITPEYYIGRKTGETPVIADMRIFDGVNSMAGNSRWVVTDVDAHLWYFRSMSRCAIEKALGKVFGNSKE